MAEYTFFVDADLYGFGAGELAAEEQDLHDAGVWSVEIPDGFGVDLGERIPVRVVGTPKGLRFYARLLGVRDPIQLEELERVLAAADARGEFLHDLDDPRLDQPRHDQPRHDRGDPGTQGAAGGSVAP